MLVRTKGRLNVGDRFNYEVTLPGVGSFGEMKDFREVEVICVNSHHVTVKDVSNSNLKFCIQNFDLMRHGIIEQRHCILYTRPPKGNLKFKGVQI